VSRACRGRPLIATGARIRLEPQKDWEVNSSVGSVVSRLETIQDEFNRSQSRRSKPTRIRSPRSSRRRTGFATTCRQD